MFFQCMMCFNNYHWSCCLKTHTAFDADNCISNMNIPANTIDTLAKMSITALLSAPCSLRYALCSMRSALTALRSALCALLYALCAYLQASML